MRICLIHHRVITCRSSLRLFLVRILPVCDIGRYWRIRRIGQMFADTPHPPPPPPPPPTAQTQTPTTTPNPNPNPHPQPPPLTRNTPTPTPTPQPQPHPNPQPQPHPNPQPINKWINKWMNKQIHRKKIKQNQKNKQKNTQTHIDKHTYTRLSWWRMSELFSSYTNPSFPIYQCPVIDSALIQMITWNDFTKKNCI